jgi:hypothetical protein
VAKWDFPDDATDISRRTTRAVRRRDDLASELPGGGVG